MFTIAKINFFYLTFKTMNFNFFVCHKQIITYFCLVVKTKMNSSFFTYTLLNIASTTEITQNLVAIIVGEMAAGGLLVYSMLNLATFFSFSKKKFSLRATIISFPSTITETLPVAFGIFISTDTSSPAFTSLGTVISTFGVIG